MLYIIRIILLLISLILSIKLIINDFKYNKVFIWQFILFILTTFILKLILKKLPTHQVLPTFLPNILITNTTNLLVRDIYIQVKILTGLIFSILLLWAVKKDKLAPADAVLIFAIFLTQNLIEFLLIICIASLTGILLAILSKRKNIPFLSILIPLWIIS